MWLDRFANQAQTPSPSPSQPGSGPYSPAPRRTASGLGPYVTSSSSSRPGITPRGSALSLVSNDSSSSLLASARRANGSALRQSTAAYIGPKPSELLEKLLGASDIEGEAPAKRPTSSITNEDLEFNFDFGGLSLQALARGDDAGSSGEDVYRTQKIEERMLAFVPTP